jgi:NAD(P)-dependent dehydrogenase (short-subunit alcohol dehydrogenase family)
VFPGCADPELCKDAVERTIDEFGKLDFLVNNAAFQEHVNSFEELTEEHFDPPSISMAISHGQGGRSTCAERQLHHHDQLGHGHSRQQGHLLDYSMTKGGIHAFTRSLAMHLVDRGIRVNAVASGPVWTPLNPADKLAEKVAQFGADTPMKRPGQPEEIAPAYVFLAAPSC